MTYSLDFRQAVIQYIIDGGKKAEASRLFKISRRSIYDWLEKKDDLAPKKQGSRFRKLDCDAIRQHVKEYPDATLKERALFFSVHINAIFYRLHQMGISYKKNSTVPRKKSS